MPTFDTARFLFNLAGALRSGPWTAVVLRAALKRIGHERGVRVPGFVGRLLLDFREQPEYAALVPFLVADRGLVRAIRRAAEYPSSPRPRASIRSARMGRPPAVVGPVEIPQLPTETVLANWLGVTVGKLCWYADVAGRNRRHPAGPLRPYRYRWVPKPSGRARLLEIPKPGLKRIQRKILDEILARIPTHDAAHGFRPGRSIVTNAAPHCGNRVVVRFDLTDFFPSVPAARVFRTFRTFGYPESVARSLCGLCTTRLPHDIWAARPSPAVDGSDHAARQRFASRHLPQGAPTSPALANLAAFRLNRRLAKFAALVGAEYTRYADDLTFSGGDDFGRRVRRVAGLVAVIAGDEGFVLNHRKTRVMRGCGRQHVAGVVVNVRPNVPRADFDRLKAILTNCVRHGPAGQNRDDHPDFRAHLAGRVAHVGAVNPIRGQKLRALWDRIAWDVPRG